MSTIKINMDDSLKYDSNEKLSVNVSQKNGNTLTIESDGLYAEAIPGNPGSVGTGFPDNYRSDNGIVSGITSPESMNQVSKRIVAPSIIHRIFTSLSPDGSDIQLRSVDVVYPGDMYRVKDTANSTWNYYVITKVASDCRTVTSNSGIVASIPLSANDVN